MQEVVELYLDDIIPNRFQPREKFEETALKELSDSIKEHGVIQPIIVRKIGEKYEIIAGERRYKASALAGLTKIPAIIRNLDDKEASKVALLENLQRKDLTAIEEARTYQKILELDTMTQEELGRTMGKSQAAIANKLRLLSLTDEVQEALLNDQISERHARSLLNITNGNDQIEMLDRVIRNRMSVRELDTEIRKMKEGKQSTLDLGSDFMTDNEMNKELSETKTINEAKIELEPQNTITPQSSLFINNDINIEKSPTETPKFINSDIEKQESTGVTSFINDLPKQEIPVKEENINSNFIPNFNKEPVMINTEDDTELLGSSTDNKEFINKFKYQDAIDAVKNIVPSLREKGVKLNIEEYDLAGKYQIIINIDKDNLN